MRVNLQYSIELEDIFEELYELFKRKVDLDDLKEHLQEASNALVFERSAIAKANIEEARKALFELDTSLSEIHEILEGHDRIKHAS